MNYHLCMSQFKTSVILCIQNFAKNDTENAELASKMLRQQHFLHQRKNLYTKNLYEVFQARQNQRILTKILQLLSPFSLPIHPRTLSELVWRRSGWDGDRGIIKEGRRETRDIKTFGRGTSGGIYGNT